MRDRNRFSRSALIVSLFLSLADTGTIVQAQERMVIQATASGTSTQMGEPFNVNIHIEQFSTPEERKTLIDTFTRSSQDGIVDALDHMKGKGRIRTQHGVNNEVKYIYELPSGKGSRHIRLVTNRRIAFVEARNSTRSEEYSIGVVDLIFTPDEKGFGRLLPACKLTVNKKTQQIEVEAYQNPWKLTNLMISRK